MLPRSTAAQKARSSTISGARTSLLILPIVNARPAAEAAGRVGGALSADQATCTWPFMNPKWLIDHGSQGKSQNHS
jgi:hypothetical protein